VNHPISDADRERLAAILGMLGSAHAGERAAAALKAEAFRQRHRLTWAELLEVAPAETPEPPQWTPPPPTPEPPMATPSENVAYGWDGWRVFSIAFMALIMASVVILIQRLL